LETLLIGTSEAEYAHKQANGVKRRSIGGVCLFPHSLSVSADSDEVVRIIRKLIDVCCGQHLCTSVPHPGTPSRLLDVGTPEEQQLRLVPWDVYRLHERPYLTLSYCWGGVPMDAPWKLTTTNLEQFMVSIPIETLPLTLREAVLLTRRLGERYIWIDSLCIIQNDQSDWVRQSSSMSRIYSGSLCTLSAASQRSIRSFKRRIVCRKKFTSNHYTGAISFPWRATKESFTLSTTPMRIRSLLRVHRQTLCILTGMVFTRKGVILSSASIHNSGVHMEM
jgi:hypothetical protein